MKTITRSIAMYVDSSGSPIEREYDPEKYDWHKDEIRERGGYVRCTEAVVVEFKMLEPDDVVQKQLAAVDAVEEKLRSELADKIAQLNNRRAELRALTHQVMS